MESEEEDIGDDQIEWTTDIERTPGKEKQDKLREQWGKEVSTTLLDLSTKGNPKKKLSEGKRTNSRMEVRNEPQAFETQSQNKLVNVNPVAPAVTSGQESRRQEVKIIKERNETPKEPYSSQREVNLPGRFKVDDKTIIKVVNLQQDDTLEYVQNIPATGRRI